RASQHVQNGGLVSVAFAFREEVAEIMHKSLALSDRWRLNEAIYPFFFYHHHNIYNVTDMSPAMLTAFMIFSSSESVIWAGEFVGSDCSGVVDLGASWYMPGDHSTPHSDSLLRRKLAFVWHLTREWEPSWGGHLVWMRGDKILPPEYNTLHLFDTRKSGRHYVMQVAPIARGQRLCWNGWWTGGEESQSDGIAVEQTNALEPTGRFRFHNPQEHNDGGPGTGSLGI